MSKFSSGKIYKQCKARVDSGKADDKDYMVVALYDLGVKRVEEITKLKTDLDNQRQTCAKYYHQIDVLESRLALLTDTTIHTTLDIEE